ncbi:MULTISPECIES: DUF2835 family protein [Rheinheimera]|uniref:DUF2835 family protein n=1 Tax=Rheinheimera TaxID=67575 RepID=UPI0010512D63|nr:DUF2835 family protein [Rheinheimera sp. D18]QBL09323.1 DUF2835 family protein [Rheinheimera sp. D18]
MHRYFFNAMLSAEQCYGYYRGDIRNIIVTADDGMRIQLNFRHFQRFIESNGIKGRFRLTLDQQGGFISLEKIS